MSSLSSGFKLHDIPQEMIVIDDMVEELEEIDANKEPERCAEIDAAIKRALTSMLEQIKIKANDIACAMRELKTLGDAAVEEGKRIYTTGMARKSKYKRWRNYVKWCLEQAGLDKVEFDTGSFAICNNSQPALDFVWMGDPESIPLELQKEPVLVVDPMKAYLWFIETQGSVPGAILAAQPPELDWDKVREYLAGHDGEYPEGVEIGKRGTHLRFV